MKLDLKDVSAASEALKLNLDTAMHSRHKDT